MKIKKAPPPTGTRKGHAILIHRKNRLYPIDYAFCGLFGVAYGGNLPSSVIRYPLRIFYEIFAMRSAIRLARLGVCLAHLLSSISTLACL